MEELTEIFSITRVLLRRNFSQPTAPSESKNVNDTICSRGRPYQAIDSEIRNEKFLASRMIPSVTTFATAFRSSINGIS